MMYCAETTKSLASICLTHQNLADCLGFLHVFPGFIWNITAAVETPPACFSGLLNLSKLSS